MIARLTSSWANIVLQKFDFRFVEIKDEKGDRYVIKIDPVDVPEIASAAEIMSGTVDDDSVQGPRWTFTNYTPTTSGPVPTGTRSP